MDRQSYIELDPTFGFGCHLTWPEFQELKTKQLEQKTSWLATVVEKEDECNFDKCPTDFCNLYNLHGFVHFLLGNHVKAVQMFEKVLEKDCDNVSALGNLYHVYKEQGRLKHKRKLECEKKMAELLDRKNINELVLARYYADRGRSVRWITSQKDKRAFKHVKYLRKAAQIGMSSGFPERGDWLFDYGLFLYTKDSYLVNLGVSNDRLQNNFREAAYYFYEMVLIDAKGTMDRTRALCWVFLGILINHVPQRRILGNAIPDAIEDLRNMSGEDCFKKAMGISNHFAVLRRVGSEYAKLRQYEYAEQLLLNANKMQESWFTHRWLANMYVAMYNDSNYSCDHDKHELLDRSISHFRKAIEFEDSQADHSDLGYVYYLKEDINSALQELTCAVQRELVVYDYFDPTITYIRWAKCLENDDDAESAKAKLEEARLKREEWRNQCFAWLDESEDDASSSIGKEGVGHGFVKEDIPGFINIFKKLKVGGHPDYHSRDSGFSEISLASVTVSSAKFDIPRSLSSLPSSPESGSSTFEFGGPKSLLSVDFIPPRSPSLTSQNSSSQMYKPHSYKYDFFMCYCKKDEEWVIPFFDRLEELGFTGCIHERDFTIGKPILTNICNCVSWSYKIIIVMTPHFCQSKYCEYEMLKAMEYSFDSVIPIMLTQCKPPQIISHLTYLPCQQGQFKKRDFERLIAGLKH